MKRQAQQTAPAPPAARPAPIYDTARPYLAAFIIFRDPAGRVAFVLRQNTGWLDGQYGLIAGKAEHGESCLQAAVREAREEAGVSVKPADLQHVLTGHRRSDLEWIDIIFEARAWSGELHNAEPHKHAALDWLDPANLPANTIPIGPFYLQQIAAGHHYAEYGW